MKRTEDATTEIQKILDLLTPAEVSEVLEALRQVYCFHCGGPARCQCWNDE